MVDRVPAGDRHSNRTLGLELKMIASARSRSMCREIDAFETREKDRESVGTLEVGACGESLAILNDSCVSRFPSKWNDRISFLGIE